MKQAVKQHNSLYDKVYYAILADEYFKESRI